MWEKDKSLSNSFPLFVNGPLSNSCKENQEICSKCKSRIPLIKYFYCNNSIVIFVCITRDLNGIYVLVLLVIVQNSTFFCYWFSFILMYRGDLGVGNGLYNYFIHPVYNLIDFVTKTASHIISIHVYKEREKERRNEDISEFGAHFKS